MSEYLAGPDLTPSFVNDALIAILPIHSKRIYDGTKVFELRKLVPRSVPRRIFLYEAGEVRALTGHVVIDRVIVGSPERVWALTGEEGTTRARFDQYFADRDLAYAYHISCAVRYSRPLPLSSIQSINAGFRVPQQFLYLQNIPNLALHLRKLAVDECLDRRHNQISLREIKRTDRWSFIRAVKTHISKGYSETGRAYAEKLLAISESGGDPEGFLTIGKSVRTIEYKGERVGFAVLTFKHGGCVKTGPVILSEEFRSRGVGKLLRQCIHAVARSLGFRKVFATVPADNPPAYQYLLSSGYRIEAHLSRPYHPKHDELVLGYLLDHKRDAGPEFIRQITPLTACERVTKPTPEVSAFLASEFSSAYCRVTEEWAVQQLELACNKGFTSKPRLVFAGSNGALLALAICLLKRGGSSKVVMLSRTGHQQSLTEFQGYIESQVTKATGQRIHRLYTQVPTKDSDLAQAFLDSGYRPEGVIEQPFSPSSDTLVLAKMLSK